MTFWHWDTEAFKLTSSKEKWGTKLPHCEGTKHHFRRLYCQCGKFDLTTIRLVLAQREADAKAE